MDEIEKSFQETINDPKAYVEQWEHISCHGNLWEQRFTFDSCFFSAVPYDFFNQLKGPFLSLHKWILFPNMPWQPAKIAVRCTPTITPQELKIHWKIPSDPQLKWDFLEKCPLLTVNVFWFSNQTPKHFTGIWWIIIISRQVSSVNSDVTVDFGLIINSINENLIDIRIEMWC